MCMPGELCWSWVDDISRIWLMVKWWMDWHVARQMNRQMDWQQWRHNNRGWLNFWQKCEHAISAGVPLQIFQLRNNHCSLYIILTLQWFSMETKVFLAWTDNSWSTVAAYWPLTKTSTGASMTPPVLRSKATFLLTGEMRSLSQSTCMFERSTTVALKGEPSTQKLSNINKYRFWDDFKIAVHGRQQQTISCEYSNLGMNRLQNHVFSYLMETILMLKIQYLDIALTSPNQCWESHWKRRGVLMMGTVNILYLSEKLHVKAWNYIWQGVIHIGYSKNHVLWIILYKKICECTNSAILRTCRGKYRIQTDL